MATLMLCSLLLHLLTIYWNKHQVAEAQSLLRLSIVLQQLTLPTQPVSLPVAATSPKPSRAKPTPKPKPKSTPKPPPAPADRPLSSIVETIPVADVDEHQAAPATGDLAEAADTKAAAASAAEDVPPTAADTPPAADGQGTPYRFDPPPSADLVYEAHVLHDQIDWFGTHTLAWQNDGSRYSVAGEAYIRSPILTRITFLSFTSKGEINRLGVAPELYTEKTRNRPATSTHFDRERNLLGFSSSSTTYARVGGEQDRASILWQLAAMGRGDADKFAPDAVIDLFVAGVRDGEVWRMQVVGLEQIRLPDGAHQAWHVVRQPPPGSHGQRIDIWLEPARQWYPVQLRFTEENGDYVEMFLSRLKIR